MPGNPRTHHGEATVKRERTANLADIQTYLETKNIESQKILDFICFEYKGNSHRVRYITDAKQIIEPRYF